MRSEKLGSEHGDWLFAVDDKVQQHTLVTTTDGEVIQLKPGDKVPPDLDEDGFWGQYDDEASAKESLRLIRGDEDEYDDESYLVGYYQGGALYSILREDWEKVFQVPDLKDWMRDALKYMRDHGNMVEIDASEDFSWNLHANNARYGMNVILENHGFKVSRGSNTSGVYRLYRTANFETLTSE